MPVVAAEPVAMQPAAAPAAAIPEDFVVDDDTELAVVQSDSELANLFIAEALDHLGTIEAKLLELDERPEDNGCSNDIFRPFHTIKGNAGGARHRLGAGVAHKVENLLESSRAPAASRLERPRSIWCCAPSTCCR